MNETLFRALGTFLDAMRYFAVSIVSKAYPKDPWDGEFFARLTPTKQEQWKLALQQGTKPINCIDYNNLATFGIKFKDELSAEIGRDEANRFISCLQELQDVRNKCQHFQQIDKDDTDRAFSNMRLVAKMLKMPDLREEIDRISGIESAPKTISTVQVQPSTKTSVAQTTDDTIFVDNDGPLPAWFNSALPHYDIRNGLLDESIFAANLSEVALGTAPEVYLNPSQFFAKTYITDGLRDISNRVVKALNGEESENRVVSLQTGFGGGKTHTLISLFHVAKGGKNIINMDYGRDILREGVSPNFNNARVAIFTDNTNNPVSGRYIAEDDITIFTLWGEIAYQLGGKEAYKRIEQNDKERIAPTTGDLKTILEAAAPSLILIDELAAYCVKASGKKVGAGTLYAQTLTFMQALTEVVSQVPRSMLIVTLPASKTEVASSEIGAEILQSLETRIVRIGASVKPVDDEEIFEVVRRRLFESWDDITINQVAKKYTKMYYDRKTDLPDGTGTAEYTKKIEKAYPFHPELVDMFRLRWGSDPRFQRTRGVLRILASIVQNLWNRRQSLQGTQALIHTSDLNLAQLPTLTGTISNLMGSNWESVLQADVAGTSSNAYKIDNENPQSNIGVNHLTQGIATTLFMASVSNTTHKGLTMKQIKLCVLKPRSFNHVDVDSALNRLEPIAHYLYSSSIGEKKYWFQSKANINILINQAKSNVENHEINAETMHRLNSSASFVHNIKVLVAPTGDVPEQQRLCLVIAEPKYAFSVGSAIPLSTKKYITDIATTRGNSNRVYRNTIFYLVCSEAGRAALNEALKDSIACQKILDEYSGQLEQDQKREITERKRTCDKSVDEAIIQAYSIVLRHSAMNGIKAIELRNFASDLSSQIQNNVLNEMKENEWLVDAIGSVVLRNNNLMPTQDNPRIKVKDVYEAFLRYDDKPMIIGEQAIVSTVNRYCTNGLFNVAVYDDDTLKKVYAECEPAGLNVNDDTMYLVPTSVTMPTPGPSPVPTPTPNPGPNPNPGGDTTPVPQPGTSKTYKKVVISGTVDMVSYSQLFASFIQTLKNNNLSIEVKFTAKNTALNPLTDNSATVKSVKESASQLGLNFEVEE